MTLATPQRHLLVIALHYPPDNTSTGVLRTLAFTRYLRNHGWRSTVLTIKPELYVSRNPEGTYDIPDGVEVRRTWACDVKKSLSVGGLYPAWTGTPDRYWPWYFAAVREAGRIMRGRRIDAVYSTYPVPTAHLIGWRTKARFGIPWLADFRDPWADEQTRGIRAGTERWLERQVVLRADRVICNTPAMRRDFMHRYPHVDPLRFVTVTNGFDEATFSVVVPERSQRFQILYPGVVDLENRNPEPLLRAVVRAIERGWLRRDDLQLTFLGCGAYGGSADFARQLDAAGLRAVTELVPSRIPYLKALQRLAGADVLVVLSDSEAGAGNLWTQMQVPAKVYEYLRLRRPILPLVRGGAVAELLASVGGAPPVSPDDIEGIAIRLREMYDRRSHSAPTEDVSNTVGAYSRESLTAVLAAELEALVPAT